MIICVSELTLVIPHREFTFTNGGTLNDALLQTNSLLVSFSHINLNGIHLNICQNEFKMRRL